MTQLRAVIYTRISRDDTGIGKANDRQEDECRRKAEYKRYEVVEVIRDVSVSAYSGKHRPGWRQVIDMVKAGEVDVVLAYHLDRITRSMRDLEELIDLSLEHGVGIDTATGDIELTSDMGRMIARILAAVARQEVERKSARQKLANKQRAAEGLPHTIPTFGYKPGNMEVDTEQRDAILYAANDVLEGTPLSEIARRWEVEFDSAPKSAQAVKHVLTNPMYAGIRVHQGQQVGTGQWPAILDMDLHLALVSTLTLPERQRGQVRARRRMPTTLLTNIGVCDRCKMPAKATRAHGKLIYGCKGGNHINTPRLDADALVLATLAERLAQPDMLTNITMWTDDRDYEAARDEVTTLRKRKDSLALAFAQGIIDEAQLAVGSTEINERLTAAEGVLLSAPEAVSLRGLEIGTDTVRSQVLALPLERQRQLIEAWLSVTFVGVGKGNHGRRERPPIEDQVVIEEAWVRAVA